MMMSHRIALGFALGAAAAVALLATIGAHTSEGGATPRLNGGDIHDQVAMLNEQMAELQSELLRQQIQEVDIQIAELSAAAASGAISREASETGAAAEKFWARQSLHGVDEAMPTGAIPQRHDGPKEVEGAANVADAAPRVSVGSGPVATAGSAEQCAPLASSQFPPAAPANPNLDAHSCGAPWNYVFSFPRGERCGYGYDAVLYDSIIKASPATCATIIDIGANWGQSTMPLLSKGWRVIAFEPVPTTASRAAFNLAQNDIPATRGVMIAAAASNQTGWSTIYLPTTRDDNAALSSKSATKNVGGSTQATRIRTIRLEDYLGSILGADSIKAIKIDAQGHELEVLYGMGKLLRTMDVTLIVENDATLQRASGKKDVDVRNYLERHGYFANCLRAKTLVSSPPGFPDCYDVIYRRNTTL